MTIVACQRGGVSNKPTLGSGQRQDTGPGILFGPSTDGNVTTNDLIHVKHLTWLFSHNYLYKKNLKETNWTCDSLFLLRVSLARHTILWNVTRIGHHNWFLRLWRPKQRCSAKFSRDIWCGNTSEKMACWPTDYNWLLWVICEFWIGNMRYLCEFLELCLMGNNTD